MRKFPLSVGLVLAFLPVLCYNGNSILTAGEILYEKALFAGILASFFFAFTFILHRSMHLGGGSWVGRW